MYMATRDYMSLKVWDIRVESHAVETYSVHDYLRSKLCTLYENDSIFDKFECLWSNNDRLVSHITHIRMHAHTRTHPFNSIFSRVTWVS